MTIIVFLVDTSASMYQRAYLGGRPSILDVAKGAVETFVKVRQRSPESRCDRYMLLTFEEPPNNIKAGWKENLSTFMNELKNLQCLGLTTMGGALKHAFDVLNLNRMQTGIDTYGQGRCPFFLEPSVILVITDGGKLSSPIGVTDDFNLPMHAPIPGSELTREPFRWDQRLFALVLRLSGTPANERDIGLVPSDDSPIDAMCEVTGGRSYCITSHRMMMQCIDSLVQKVQSGVVINFEKIGPDPVAIEARLDDVPDSIMIEDPDSDTGDISDTRSIRNLQSYVQLQSSYNNNVTGTAWHSCRRMIYVPRSAQKGFAVGFWPIPESFWPDVSISVLPPRSAHPNVKFTCMNQDPMVIENLPFDKYELEPSPLTQHILARKQPTTCWQVFVPNSYKNSDVGHPFGYLKASTNLTCVNLFVMPYNYPVLLPLLDELFKVHRLKPTNEWNQLFRNYMRTMPSYYAGPLRRALTRMGAPNSLAQTLMPDNMDTTLSFSVLNYIKKLKNQAKIEFDRLCNDVLTRQNAAMKSASNGTNSSGVRVTPRSVLKRDFITHPLLVNKFLPLREQLNEYGGFVVGLPTGKTNINTKSYRNPFDIHRYNLLDQVVRMRANFLQPFSRMKLIDDDVTHSLPINQMGNYQEYLKRMPAPLRELESAPVRQHMFGNPFKIDKRMMVDEADIDLVGASSGTGTGRGTKRLSGVPHEAKLPQKRRPGPIPRDKTVRKPSSIILPHIMHNETMTLDLPIIPEELDSKATSKTESPSPSTLKVTVSDYGFNFDSDLAPEIKIEDRKSLENGLPLTESHQIINVESTSLFQSSDDAFPEDSSDILYSYSSIQTDNSKVTNKDLSTRTIMDNINESLQIFGKNDSSHVYRVFNDQPENEENIMPDESIDFDAYNRGIKKKLFSDVRKPGKNYRPLLDRLMLLRGDIEMREAIIRQVHKEALRFKREKMAKAISQYLVLNHIENNNSNS